MFTLPSDTGSGHHGGRAMASVSSSERNMTPSFHNHNYNNMNNTHHTNDTLSTEGSDDDDDASSAPSPSFLPSHLSSSPATSTPNRRTRKGNASSSPSSSTSSGSSSDMDEKQKRLVLLAKHPHANERSVAQVLQKQKRQQEAAAAAAKRKSTQFRHQQKQHDEMEQQRISKFKQQQRTEPPRYSNRTVLTENSSSDEEELDEESLQIVYQSPQAAAQANRNAAAAVVWQAAGQGSGEGSLQSPTTQSSTGSSSPQRISFSARELPPPEGLEEQPVYGDNKPGIVGFAAAVFSKIFPNDPSQTSSGASILSESLDGRSVNTANKSLASKATCSSAQTRKMNNLSAKSLHARDNKMNSIHEDDDRDDRGIFRFVSTRNGLIICVLILVLIIAVIITVGAALRGQEINSDTTGSQAPIPPDLSIPTMPPVSAPSPGSIAPTVSNGEVFPPPFAQPSPTDRPTLRPSDPPSASPTSSPSSSPTAMAFFDWTWAQLGLSFQGSESSERYGQALALSDDGKVLAIGAPSATVDGKSQAGLVHIFQWDNDDRRGWISRGLLQGRNAGDQFGSNLAISSDGSVLAVSEPTYRGRSGDRSGNVRIFIHSPFNGYSPLGQELEGADATDHFGIGLSLSSDGKRIAVGAPYHDNTSGPGNGNGNGNGNNRLVSGHARVFEWTTSDGAWKPIGQPMTGDTHLDWFGWSVDLNQDGSIVCVGAPRNLLYGGYVQCFEETDSGAANSEWTMVGDTIINAPMPTRYDDNFGTAVRVSWDPSNTKHRVAIGSPGKNRDGIDSGVAIVYEIDSRDSSKGWAQLGQGVVSPNPSSNNQFGSALDFRGDLLAVGIPGAGHVNLYRFESDSDEWEMHPRTFQGVAGSNFGAAVQITSAGSLAIGSPQSTGVVQVYETSRT